MTKWLSLNSHSWSIVNLRYVNVNLRLFNNYPLLDIDTPVANIKINEPGPDVSCLAWLCHYKIIHYFVPISCLYFLRSMLIEAKSFSHSWSIVNLRYVNVNLRLFNNYPLLDTDTPVANIKINEPGPDVSCLAWLCHYKIIHYFVPISCLYFLRSMLIEAKSFSHSWSIVNLRYVNVNLRLFNNYPLLDTDTPVANIKINEPGPDVSCLAWLCHYKIIHYFVPISCLYFLRSMLIEAKSFSHSWSIVDLRYVNVNLRLFNNYPLLDTDTPVANTKINEPGPDVSCLAWLCHYKIIHYFVPISCLYFLRSMLIEAKSFSHSWSIVDLKYVNVNF